MASLSYLAQAKFLVFATTNPALHFSDAQSPVHKLMDKLGSDNGMNPTVRDQVINAVNADPDKAINVFQQQMKDDPDILAKVESDPNKTLPQLLGLTAPAPAAASQAGPSTHEDMVVDNMGFALDAGTPPPAAKPAVPVVEQTEDRKKLMESIIGKELAVYNSEDGQTMIMRGHEHHDIALAIKNVSGFDVDAPPDPAAVMDGLSKMSTEDLQNEDKRLDSVPGQIRMAARCPAGIENILASVVNSGFGIKDEFMGGSGNWGKIGDMLSGFFNKIFEIFDPKKTGNGSGWTNAGSGMLKDIMPSMSHALSFDEKGQRPTAQPQSNLGLGQVLPTLSANPVM